jgi:hypothetical protein
MSCSTAALQCRVSKLLCCLAALHDFNAFNLLYQCIALQVLSCSRCVRTVYFLALNLSVCHVPYSQELHTHAAAAIVVST